MREKTWKIVRWDNEPADTAHSIPLDCECGCEARLTTGPLIGGALIAITQDNGLVFDPPDFVPQENWMPTEIQCRECGLRLVSRVYEDVADINEKETEALHVR